MDTLREKITALIADFDYVVDGENEHVCRLLADAILQIPEIKAGQEALMERRINAMSPSQFGAMLLDHLPDARPKT